MPSKENIGKVTSITLRPYLVGKYEERTKTTRVYYLITPDAKQTI